MCLLCVDSIQTDNLSSMLIYFLDIPGPNDYVACPTHQATSALDAQSEHYVQSALQKIFEEHSGGKTIISIAHRLSTIRHATTIAVMQNGAIVQTGTFDDLSTKEGPFRDLMKTQLVGDISNGPKRN